MYDYDVVIIDSGFDIRDDLNAISIENVDGLFSIGHNLKDVSGHGTIIYTIISKAVSKNRIFAIKMPYSEKNQLSVDSLIFALRYVNDNMKCKVVNISLGVRVADDLSELESVCKELGAKGTVIVSAFDNDGCHSYPAAFDCVIGVDSKNDFGSVSDIDYVENSPIDVFAKGNIQRLRMVGGKNLLIGGASIACAYVTGILSNCGYTLFNIQQARNFLKSQARYIYSFKENSQKRGIPFDIKNAVVFPFSKEEHAFLRFSEYLSFKIVDYYDVRRSGKVGRRLSSYCEGIEDDCVIKNVDQIDFKNVDTLILGHLDELNYVSKKDYRKELIKKAALEGVNVFSFDPLDQYENVLSYGGVKYYYPHLEHGTVLHNSFNKLYKISKPVIGIFGTSSQQGKFSLQISLKHSMEKKGYIVGSVGTEPHSLLFGFDVVFPMGYNATIDLDNNEIVAYLNSEINLLCLENKELIITSSQSQTIPYYCNNLLEYPPYQYYFALGTNPDAVILCINYYDEVEYIRNTIYTLKGLTDAKVIALMLYPITLVKDWNGVYGISKRKVTVEEYEEKRQCLQGLFQIPVYFLGNDDHMEKLCENIIDFF